MPKRLSKVIDYKKVFNSAEGKRVLYDLMREGHILGPAYYPNEPNSVYVNEGKRNMVLFILEKLKTDTVELKALIDKEVENERRSNLT